MEKTERLSQARVKAYKPSAKRYWVKDEGTRLQLRIYPSGKKKYRVRGRIGHGRTARQFERVIRNALSMTVDEARRKAEQLWQEANDGTDVMDGAKPVVTIGDLIDDYELALKRREIVKRKDMKYALRANLKSQLRKPADNIDRLQDRGKHGAAGFFRKTVISFMNWAVNTGRLDANPISGFRMDTSKTQAAKQTGRALPVSELGELWLHAEASAHYVFRDYIRFLILTGVRRGEAAQLRRDQLQPVGDGYIWTIP